MNQNPIIRGVNDYHISLDDFDRVILDESQWERLPRRPQVGCKHCLGRGYLGRRFLGKGKPLGHYVPCPCTGLTRI